MRRFGRQTLVYVLLLAGAFLVAVGASWTALGARIDNYAYDTFFKTYQPPPWRMESMLLAIDEETLVETRNMRAVRKPMADALELVAAARPKAVAVDVILAGPDEEASDAALEHAFSRIPNLVLAAELMPDGRRWEEPLPRFARHAAAVGHVHAQPDRLDYVNRVIPLEKATARVRRWALALEAFRVSRGAAILESPEDVQVGDVVIPAARLKMPAEVTGQDRRMRIRYVPPSMGGIPRVGMKELLEHPARAAEFTGKVVFVGVTAQSELRDRLFTPYSEGSTMAGLEINANAFETIAQRMFISDARRSLVVLFALLLVTATGFAFARLPGWWAYIAALLILLAAHTTPYVFFRHGSVFSLMTPASAAWMSVVTAAAYQHRVVRRSLRRAESERTRYQQAMHFVTHEMKTPLTAIQGSSELISRYAFTDEKRKQIAQMINSESKRLARMIEMFLNVERLSAGQMELKRETFSLAVLLAVCVERARVLAARKQIRISLEPVAEDINLNGDRELVEYACYNLLSNAVKYSPQNTETTVSVRRDRERIRISVRDQGIGLDHKEVKQIFQKFYRTKRAEQSGEAGTGIGLSIVEQIVAQHGGAIDVTSQPGEGSCFTLMFPAAAPVAAPAAAERQ
jgi:signal transduction histidine kinase